MVQLVSVALILLFCTLARSAGTVIINAEPGATQTWFIWKDSTDAAACKAASVSFSQTIGKNIVSNCQTSAKPNFGATGYFKIPSGFFKEVTPDWTQVLLNGPRLNNGHNPGDLELANSYNVYNQQTGSGSLELTFYSEQACFNFAKNANTTCSLNVDCLPFGNHRIQTNFPCLIHDWAALDAASLGYTTANFTTIAGPYHK